MQHFSGWRAERLPWRLQAAGTKPDHVATKAQKKKSREIFNQHSEEEASIISIRLGSGQLTEAPKDKLEKAAAVCNARTAVLQGSVLTPPNYHSTWSIDNAPYCRFCLQQTHKTIKCRMISYRLREELTT